MAAKKRIGRPPKAKEDRKAVNFTFRSRGQMRERLQTAAIAAGRSISEEIEFRLEKSFWQEETERDTAKLQVALSERLRSDLEQAAKHHDWSMNTEIVSRLDASLQSEALEKMIARAVKDGLKAQQKVTKKRIAAERSKSKRETPAKGEGSK